MKNFWQDLKKKKKPILALAPMAGITDSAFRILCKDFGCNVVYSEMVSADALCHDSKKTFEMLEFDPVEQPLVIQLFGKNSENFGKAAKIVEQSGASGIDINFGCPAKKVVRHGGGVTLMRNLDLCHDIIRETVDAVKIPVSVKIRTSIKKESNSESEERVTALDFLEKIKDLDVSALMIHGRSYEHGFRGNIDEVDFAAISNVKKKFKGVVLSNGGINSPEDAKLILDKTGTDGIGLARALYGKPWLFKQIKDYFADKKYQELEIEEVKKIALRHAELLFKTKGSKGMLEIRKHLTWYMKGFDGASEMRKKLVLVENVKEVEDVLFGALE